MRTFAFIAYATLIAILVSITLVPSVLGQAQFVVEYKILSADKDCYVWQSFPDENQFCTTEELNFVQSLSGSNERSFLHFNTALTTSGISGTIINASVSMFKFGVSAGGNRTYEISRALVAWTEEGVTWNNQPSAGVDTSTTVIALGTAGWYSFNASAIVRSWIENNTEDNGIRIKDVTENEVSPRASGFRSRENPIISERPVLHVNMTGLGNYFVSGLIAFAWISILIIMVLGSFWIVYTVRNKSRA